MLQWFHFHLEKTPLSYITTVHNSSCGQVMFSQVSIILLNVVMVGHVWWRGHAWQVGPTRGYVWQGACVVKACSWWGGLCGERGAMHCKGGHVWWRGHVWQVGHAWQGGVCGRGHAWWACMARCMCGRGPCIAGGACVAGGMHGRGRCPL